MSFNLKALLGLPDDEIVVQSDPNPTPKLRDGIIHKGFFSRGQTGGNILGALGDAFLAQAGQPDHYAPRLQQDREAEAVEGFTQDPRKAAEALSLINRKAGGELWDTAQDNQRQAAEAASVAQARKELSEANVHQRNFGYLGAATAATWPGIRAKVLQDYSDRGMTLPFELPEKYDPTAIQHIIRGGVAPKDQLTLDANESYRAKRLAQMEEFERGRTLRTGMTTGVRQTEGQKTRDFRKEENEKDRTVRKEIAATRGGRTKPTIKYGPIVNGIRTIIK